MEEKPNYYAIIPANVRYDENINSQQKLLYGEITALCSKEGKCYATNKYFAELYQKSEVTISNWINELAKKEYIKVELFKIRYDDGTVKQIRNIYVNQHKDFDENQHKENDYQHKDFDENQHKDFDENQHKENFKQNNTSNINNTSNNNNIKKNNIKKENYFQVEKVNDIFVEFLEMRKKLKAVNSDRAIKTLINKLNKYDDETKFKMIENSIVNSWKDVYEIRKENKHQEIVYEAI